MPKLFPLAMLVLLGTPALAQEEPAPELEIVITSEYLRMNWERVQGEVRYGDLDLTTDAGVETFRSRTRAEAHRLCGRTASSLRAKTDQKSCTDSIFASANPQIEKLVTVARAK